MATRIITSSAEETLAAGRALAECLAAGDVVLLSGDLGAGKTVLVKGVAKGLGVDEPVTSPTFNILLVHVGRLSLHHFDLYRLERPEELVDIDYAGTLEAPGVSFVEWGDRFAEARPRDYLGVEITISGDTARDLACCGQGERSEELLECWMRRCTEEDVTVTHPSREPQGDDAS